MHAITSNRRGVMGIEQEKKLKPGGTKRAYESGYENKRTVNANNTKGGKKGRTSRPMLQTVQQNIEKKKKRHLEKEKWAVLRKNRLGCGRKKKRVGEGGKVSQGLRVSHEVKGKERGEASGRREK